MYSDLCQRKAWVWEHLHLFPIIPRICCRMYVIHLVIQEITFVANSLPIRNFIEFVSHAVASYEVWKDGDLWCPSCCNILQWGLHSGRHWDSSRGLSLGCSGRCATLGLGHLFWGAQNLLVCSCNPFSLLVFRCCLGNCVLKSSPVCSVLPSLKPGPTFETVFLFALKRYSLPSRPAAKERWCQPIPHYFLLENQCPLLPRGLQRTFMVSKCYYFVIGLLVGERQIPLGLILCLSNIFHVHVCGTHVYRCVCTVRGSCECVYICIWGPELGIMGFSWLLSTLFTETEFLN